MAVFEDESGPEPPDTGRPLEAGKGKETFITGTFRKEHSSEAVLNLAGLLTLSFVK